MKVTLLCLEWPNENHSGGVARYAYRMATALSAYVDLTVVTTDGGLDLPSAKMVTIRKPWSRFDRYYVLPVVASQAVRRQAPDVIHSFGDDWPLSRRGAPIVRSFFGSSWSESKASSGIRRMNHALLAVTEKYSQLRSDMRIAIAPETVHVFKCQRLMPPVVEVVPRTPIPSKSPSVIFIGSFGGRKRGSFAEKVVREVSSRLGTEIKLTVVGPASDRGFWRPETNHVSGASDQEVKSMMLESWALLSPSSYEGFGIPLFEALSLGVPAIASRNPGSTYFESLCAGREALAVAQSDAEFVDLLQHRISAGPVLNNAARSDGKKAVEHMLKLASIPRLVDEVYLPLVVASR